MRMHLLNLKGDFIYNLLRGEGDIKIKSNELDGTGRVKSLIM